MEGVVQLPDAPAAASRVRYMDRYFGYFRIISMGPRGTTNFLRYWTVFFIVVGSSGTLLSAMCHKVVFHAGDLDGIAAVVDFLTVFISGLFRFFHARFYGEKYVEIVSFVHDNFIYESFGHGKKQNMDKYMKISKFIAYAYIMVTQIWMLQMSFGPFVHYYIQRNMRYENGTAMYPDAKLTMIINLTLPTDNYHVGLSHTIQITAYYSLTFIYIFTDAFWFVLIILTTGQFELVADSLRNILESGASNESEEGERKQIERILLLSLTHHSLMRELVHKMDNLMSSITLVDFLHAVASISFILLDTTVALNKSDWVQVLNISQYLAVSVFHMFMLDFIANKLSLKEQEIAEAVYSIPWYKYPLAVKEKVVLITQLSRNPCQLTGGKLYTISLEFFTATMRTIVSYFTFLLRLREDLQAAAPNPGKELEK